MKSLSDEVYTMFTVCHKGQSACYHNRRSIYQAYKGNRM